MVERDPSIILQARPDRATYPNVGGDGVSICYEFEMEACCPIDGTRDRYEVRVDTHEMIEVEQLISVAEAMSHRVIFQEKLTKELHLLMPVTCSVTTVGLHSGVRVTVTVES